jgi:hypothetical protein
MLALRNLGSRFKVGTRIAIGFASILMLLAAAAGTGYWGLSTSDDNIRKFDRVSDAYAAVAKLQNNFEQMPDAGSACQRRQRSGGLEGVLIPPLARGGGRR